MGAHKYDKLISIWGISYSNHTVIHMFSPKSLTNKLCDELDNSDAQRPTHLKCQCNSLCVF